MRALTWFDSWVQRGPFTALDLGRYRVVYAILLLLIAPRVTWLDAYPDSFSEPAPGPFALLNGFPSLPVLMAVEIVVFVLVAAVMVGLYTTLSSIALTVMLIVDYGLAFSVGKIDHSMVMAIVPAIMAFAQWGDSFSIDALRRRRREAIAGTPAHTKGLVSSAAAQPQWPMRFLALAIGVAFVTAALPKLLGGWLSFSTQASYAYQVKSNFVSNRPSPISSMLVDLHVPAVWELLDWSTVFMEGVVILAIFSWRSWRIALAVLTLFHIGIGLSLGIFFASNVVAYGAFVSWGQLRLPKVSVSQRTTERLTRWAIPLVLVLGGLCWLFVSGTSPWIEGFRAVIVFAAGAVGVGYLIFQGRDLLAWWRARRSAGATSVPS